MKREERLLWADLVTIYLWHRYPKESLIEDDRAWVALLRVSKWIEFALSAIEAPAPITTLDKE